MKPNILIAELSKPDYDALTTEQKATALLDKNILPDGQTVFVSRESIRAAFNAAEFIGLTTQRQNTVLAVLTSDQVAVEGADATLLAAAFTGATSTLAALVELRNSTKSAAQISIADQLGFGDMPATTLQDWINKLGA